MPHFHAGLLSESAYRKALYPMLEELANNNSLALADSAKLGGSMGGVVLAEGGEYHIVLTRGSGSKTTLPVRLVMPRYFVKTWKTGTGRFRSMKQLAEHYAFSPLDLFTQMEQPIREVINTFLVSELVRCQISPCFPMLLGACCQGDVPGYSPRMYLENLGICLWDVFDPEKGNPYEKYDDKKKPRWIPKDPEVGTWGNASIYSLLNQHADEFIFELAYAISAMQVRYGMLHCDLKPDNVCLRVFDKPVTRHYVLYEPEVVAKAAKHIHGQFSTMEDAAAMQQAQRSFAGGTAGESKVVTIQNRVQPYIMDMGLAITKWHVPTLKHNHIKRAARSMGSVLQEYAKEAPGAIDMASLSGYMMDPGLKAVLRDPVETVAGTELAGSFPSTPSPLASYMPSDPVVASFFRDIPAADSTMPATDAAGSTTASTSDSPRTPVRYFTGRSWSHAWSSWSQSMSGLKGDFLQEVNEKNLLYTALHTTIKEKTWIPSSEQREIMRSDTYDILGSIQFKAPEHVQNMASGFGGALETGSIIKDLCNETKAETVET